MFELNESEQYELFFELARNLSHPMREVRLATVSAIARVANRRCTNILLDKLDLERDVIIKASIIRILGDIGTENLVSELGRYLHNPEPRIRANAVESFARIKVPDARWLVPHLEPLIQDENNRVSSTALKEVIALGETRCLPFLKLFLKGTDPARKASAVWVVGELDLEDMLEDIIYALYSENYQVHSIAHRVLGRFSENAIPILFENLALGDITVRAYTFLFFSHHLREVTEEQRILLLEHLEKGEGVLAGFVLKSLLNLRNEESWRLLKIHAAGGDPALRRVAVESIGLFLGRDDIKPLLMELIRREKDPRLLGSMVHHLKGFADEETIDLLQNLIQHEDRRVCANAVEVLGEIGDDRIREHLIPLLEDSNNRVMANVAVALFRLGEQKVVSKLRLAMDSRDESLRVSASWALGRLGASEVSDLLLKGLLDDVEKVRRNVLDGLLREDREAFGRLIGILKKSGTLTARKALAEVSSKASTREEACSVSDALQAYADNVNVFEVPSELSKEEEERLTELLFSEDRSLKVYACFVLGEKKVIKSLPRLICLLFERDDEVVAEALMALKKLGSREALVFLRDIFSRLRGENMRLCAEIMQSLSGGKLKSEDFPVKLGQTHQRALEQAVHAN